MAIVDIIYKNLKKAGIEEAKAREVALGIMQELDKYAESKLGPTKLWGADGRSSQSKGLFGDETPSC
jgi:hypothetical protein